MSIASNFKMSRKIWSFNWNDFAQSISADVADNILSALQDECPVGEGDTAGDLQDSIVYDVQMTETGLRIEFTSDSDHAKFVLEGTQAHEITPVSAAMLYFIGSEGDDVYAPVVQHPGTEPNPFNERAWENVRDDTILALGQSVKASLK